MVFNFLNIATNLWIAAMKLIILMQIAKVHTAMVMRARENVGNVVCWSDTNQKNSSQSNLTKSSPFYINIFLN